MARNRYQSRLVAFSLIETCVVITIVAALLAVAIPILSSIQSQRGRVATLSRLKNSAAIIMLYASDERNSLPLPLNPSVDRWKISLASGWSDTAIRYFESIWLWHVVMSNRYFDGKLNPPVTFAAARNGRGTYGSRFKMPCAYFARPEFWDQSTRTGRSQYGGHRLDEILFPASKTLLVSIAHVIIDPSVSRDHDPMPGMVPAAMADGSAAVYDPGRLLPGVKTGEGRESPGMLHPFDAYYGMHTVNGIRGRDIR